MEDAEDLALLEARDLLFARLLQYRAYKQVAALFVELEAGAARRFPRSVALEERFAALLPEVLLGVDPAAFAELAAVGVPAQAAAHGRRRPPARPRRCRSPSTRRSCASGCAELGEATLRRAHRRLRRPRSRWSPGSSRCSTCSASGAVDLEQPEPFGELTVRWTGTPAVPDDR